MSAGPNAVRVVSTSAVTASSSATSQATAMAVPPRARISSTTSWIEPGSRSSEACSVRAAIATAAPSPASRAAIAAPMPRLPPVTIATRSSKRPIASRNLTRRTADRLTYCPERLPCRFAPETLLGRSLWEEPSMSHVDLREVAATVNELRPMLQGDGGDLELVGVDDGVVRLRLLLDSAECAE